MHTKRLVMVLALLLLCSPCFAQVINVYDAVVDTGTTAVPAVTSQINVATQSVIYTKSMRIDDGMYYALSYKIGGRETATTSTITIQVEQGYDVPLVEGTANTISTTYSVPVNMPDVVTNSASTSTIWYHKSLNFAPLRYARFRIAGGASNSTDTTVQLKLSKLIL
jgi:hypothetical protein